MKWNGPEHPHGHEGAGVYAGSLAEHYRGNIAAERVDAHVLPAHHTEGVVVLQMSALASVH